MKTCYSGLYTLPSTMNHHRFGTQYMMEKNSIYSFKNPINAASLESFETKRCVDAIKNELLCYLNVSRPIHILCSCLVDLSDRLMRSIPQISYYYPHDKDTLVELLFTAIKKANHCLYSSTSIGIVLQDQHKDSLRMLLIHAISLSPRPFSFPQFIEILNMISRIPTTSFANTNSIRSYETGVVEAASDYQNKFASYETGVVEAGSDYQNKFARSWMYVNGKGFPTPMPSQETASSSMNLNPNVSLPVSAPQNTKNPYGSDVVQAVSTYRKKFAGSWMCTNANKLPSPTRLQEADYTWDFDTIDEISSSMNPNPNDSLAMNAPQNTENLSESDLVEAVSNYRQKFAGIWMYTNANELPSPTRSQEAGHTEEWNRICGISSSINLRVNPDVSLTVTEPTINLMKRKTAAELVLDGPELKRQRNDTTCESGEVCLKPCGTTKHGSVGNTIHLYLIGRGFESPLPFKKKCRKPHGSRRNHYKTTSKVVSKTMPDEPEVNTPINPTESSTTKPQDIIITNELITNKLTNKADNLTSVNLFQKETGLVCEQLNPGPVQHRKANALRDVEHFLEGYNEQQKADFRKERARRLEEQKKLFTNRKLSLVLDLDLTLLNSVNFEDVDPPHAELLRKKEKQERGKPEQQLFQLPHMSMWTKLRPGIWKFLEKASKMFELHISTMGNKCYATEMAKLLDPKGELFSGRVISQCDDSEQPSEDVIRPKTKNMEGILGMDSSVVIIDDTVSVWPHHKLNLINVDRYIFFPSTRRQLGLSGLSLLEVDRDDRQEDGTLASALALIKNIHESFFANDSVGEADVRDILASEQRKVLAGCRILFSRIIPIGEANPDRHPLWQTAERFGAVCTSQIDDQVTHVVARSLGTGKVNWALSKGRFVVHPGWLEASAFSYRRANEQDFVIKQQK